MDFTTAETAATYRQHGVDHVTSDEHPIGETTNRMTTPTEPDTSNRQPASIQPFVHLGRDCMFGRSLNGQEFWLGRTRYNLEGRGDYSGTVQEVDIIWDDGKQSCLACVLKYCKMCRDLLDKDWNGHNCSETPPEVRGPT